MLEDEIAATLSNEIAKEIDFEVLSLMLIKCGWFKVQLESLISRKRSIDIIEWCESNTKHRYKSLGRTFVFQDQGDAVNFSLMWANK
jgi:hypothetical protein